MALNQLKSLSCSAIKVAVTSAIAISLVACGGNDMSDLDTYVAEVKARPKKRIEPLPEIKTFPSYTYVAAGLRDPFVPSTPEPAQEDESAQSGYTGIKPDFNRNKEELEFHPLDSLRMVGTLEQKNTRWGILRASDGTIHRVRTGNHLGQNYGEILDVSETEIVLKEIIPNGTGGWQERAANIALVENDK